MITSTNHSNLTSTCIRQGPTYNTIQNDTSRNTSTTRKKYRTPTQSNQVSFQIINVCGLKRKLLDIPEFKDTLIKHDISLLCETKLDDVDKELINESINNINLKAFYKNRETRNPWRSGGLCIIYNVNIEKHLTYVESKCNLVQWLKIDKSLMGTDKDIVIGNTYIPPVGTKYVSATPYLDLQDELMRFRDSHICITGDLNSHTGTKRDYVVSDDFIPDQLNFDMEAQALLNNIAKLNTNNCKLNRSNEDPKQIDIYGKHLIEFCKSNGLLICNGRLNSEPNGKATTTQGSVIDYLLANPCIIKNIRNFSVHDFDAIFSDKHSRVSWSIMCSTPIINSNSNKESNIISIKKTHRNMWTSEKAIPFSEQLDINEVNNIRENLSSNVSDVTCILNRLQKLFENTANMVLGPEVEFKIDANAKQKPIKFTRETLNIRNKYYKAKKTERWLR